MRRPSRWIWLFVVAVGCAGGGERKDAGTPFTVWIYNERNTVDGTDTPVANARVAFDFPNRERVVKTTAADGHVTFEGDFARGSASVTVLSDDHVFVTMLETSPNAARARPNRLGKPPEDLVVFAPPLDPFAERATVGLRGNIAGKLAPDDIVELAASGLPRLGHASASEATYSVRAPRDRPFFLLGHERKSTVDAAGVTTNEVLKAFRIDMSATAEDELLDLDLVKVPRLPMRRTHFRVGTPTEGAVAFEAGTGVAASIVSADSSVAVGVFESGIPTADGRAFDVTLARIDVDVAPERVLTQVVLTAPDGSQSMRTESGVSADGTVLADFRAPPSIPDADADRMAKDPISLDQFPAGAELIAHVYGGKKLLWILHGPPGGPREKSFRIPYRNEINEAAVQIFAISLSACWDRVLLPGRGEYCRYTSTFRDVLMRKT